MRIVVPPAAKLRLAATIRFYKEATAMITLPAFLTL